jgi:hypothetical protein
VAILVAVGLSVYLFVSWTIGHPAPGWTSIMFGMAFFFGIQFLLMGLSGEYLHRIYLEVVKRPLYFISDNTPSGCERADSAAATPAKESIAAEPVGDSHGS